MRRYVIILALLLGTETLPAQIETTQYFMTAIPQVVDNNPAFTPKYNFALGLPFSRVSVFYTNNGFTYSDATRKENGNTVLDLPKLQKALPDKTYITNASQVDLFRLGLRLGPSNYLSIHSTVRGYTQAMLPNDILGLMVSGTAPYVGQTANLSPTFHGMTFWETGVGLSTAPTEKLKIGARIKKLYGTHSVKTELSDITLSVADNYAMTVAADVHVRTSGIQDSEPVVSNYLRNSGWSGDLGFTYKVMSKLTLAASVVDLGYIKWNNNVYDYKLNKGTANFSFGGLDLSELMDGNTDSFDQQLDSLGENFTPVEAPGAAYRMTMPAKFYLSGTFDITKSFNVGGVFFAENFMGRTAPGFTTAVNKNFGRLLSTSVSYTLSNRSHNALGAGISFNLAPVQIYVIGDDLLRAPVVLARTGFVNDYINNTQVFNVRFGINFVWGWKKETAPVQEEDNSKSYNSGKKDSSKPLNEDNSKSYNSGKSGGKATVDAKKQPQPKKTKQPSHIRARQRLKP